MRRPGLAGVMWTGRGQSAGFAAPTERAYGNQIPGLTGPVDRQIGPSPGPYTGGQMGGKGDGATGADPSAPKVSPYPESTWLDSWGEGQIRNPAGPGLPPFPYGGLGTFQGRGWGGQLGGYWSSDPTSGVPDQQQSFRRNGTLGFNDKLTVKDRGAYWDTGNQKTGTDPWASGGIPNSRNNPLDEPPRPDLRTINRTVSYQKGSDTTANQDDLSRPYSPAAGTRGFIGEQGSGWAPIYGGVPGLYQPYGSRGGVPFPIVSPAEFGQVGDGPHLVFAGPPHGLHSQTPWKGGAQIISRFMSIPQTRPVRQDRPSNSPQAGQSYSQTVRPQGSSPVRPAGGRPTQYGSASGGGLMYGGGRGWVGQWKTNAAAQSWLLGRGGGPA